MLTQRSLFDDAPSVAVEPSRPAIVRPTAPRRPTADPAESERRKQAGVARALANSAEAVAHARGIAYAVAFGELPHADGIKRADGLCSMDDVKAGIDADNAERRAKGMRPIAPLLNAAGGVFAGNPQVWEFSGQFVKSVRPQSHANLLRVWRLKHRPE